MNQREIGNTIRTRRKLLRLTQEQLAELAGCSKPSIIAAEAGKPTLRLDILFAILRVLNLHLRIEGDE
jgi:y4mF family transcriptional regulator